MNISGLDLASTAASLADPTPITHFASLGFDIFRIPFKWEQLTPTLGGSLSTTLMPLMMNFVTLCTSTQVICILDMHNYAQYNGQLIGASGGPTQADLVSAWSQLAAYSGIKNNQYIRFGIMNEPSGGLTTAEWQTISNATVAGIRAAGATNTVQVTAPGGGMDIGTIPGFVDSANAQIYEGHQYTDTGSAGVGRVANTYEYIALTDIFVGQYLQLGSTMKLMWGEVGFDNAATALTSENLWLQYVQQNSDIFEGVTFWGAGKEFGTSYVYDMNPNNGVEQPQVVEAENFLPGGSSYGVVEPIDAYTPTLLGGSSAAFTAAKSGPFPKSSKGSVGETSAQIETPYWPDPKGSTALTSEVWFNAASAAQAGSGTLVGGNGTQQVAIYGTNLELTSGNSSTVVSYTTPVAPYLDGKWHHFEVDADGTGTWMFIDGQSVKTSTTGWSASGPSEQFPMGVRSNGKSGGTASTAALAGAAFWTYARHTANFTLATDYYAGTESGIAAYFPLNGDIDCWL